MIYYVNWNTGNDTYDGTSPVFTSGSTGPKKTIGGGWGVTTADGDIVSIAASTEYTQAASYLHLNNARSVTFQGDTGVASDVVLTAISGQANCVLINTGVADKTITFKNMTINGNGQPYVIRLRATLNISAPSIIFDNVKSTGASFVDGTSYDPGTAVRSLQIINGCNITCTGKVASYKTVSGLTVLNSTLTSAAGNMIEVYGDVGNIDISSNTLNLTASSGYIFKSFTSVDGSTPTTDLDTFKFMNNTITTSTEGISVPEFADRVYVANNILTLTSTGQGPYAITLGVDGDTSLNPMGQVSVSNNRITYAANANCGHGILIGAGIDNSNIVNNTVLANSNEDTTANIGIVVKGDGNVIEGNIVRAKRALYLKGATRSFVRKNTLLADGLYALQWAISTDNPEKNVIENNIIDGSEGSYAIYISNGSHGNNILNYNCYLVGSTAFGYDAGTATAYADLTAWLAQIATWSASDLFWSTNDNNSISVNPQYKDAANGDFSLLSSSPCINAGKPTLNGGKTTIGAYQPESNATLAMVTEAVDAKLQEYYLDHLADSSGRVDIGKWLGTTVSTPTVAGVPKVDIEYIGGSVYSDYLRKNLVYASTLTSAVTAGDSIAYVSGFPTGVQVGDIVVICRDGITSNVIIGSVIYNGGSNIEFYPSALYNASSGNVIYVYSGSTLGAVFTQELGTQAKLDVNAEADTAITDAALAKTSELASVKLAADGLDNITNSEPAVWPPQTLKDTINAIYRWCFNKKTATNYDIKLYGDDDETVITTQPVDFDGATKTVGKPE